MSRSWRNQYWYNETASKFHETFRQLILQEPRLNSLSCYQEVNVRDLVPHYPYEGHHYDWYILEMDLIVELHGSQHYKPTNFNRMALDDLDVEFRRQQYRDEAKKGHALQQGFLYMCIPYSERKKLTYDTFIKYLQENK